MKMIPQVDSSKPSNYPLFSLSSNNKVCVCTENKAFYLLFIQHLLYISIDKVWEPYIADYNMIPKYRLGGEVM